MNQPSMKKTLLQFRRETDVTTKAIAQLAQLPTSDVFVVETGGYVSAIKALRVIRAFNQFSGI